MSNTLFKNLTITAANVCLFEPALLTEQVEIITLELPSFPEKSNPFHHDSMSMGVDISCAYTMMLNTPEKEHGSQYLFNRNTGQRFSIITVSKYPRPKKIISLAGSDHLKFKSDHFFEIDSDKAHNPRSNNYYFPRSVFKDLNQYYEENPNALETPTPIYWVCGDCALLYYKGIENDLDELMVYQAGDYVSDESILKAYQTLLANLTSAQNN